MPGGAGPGGAGGSGSAPAVTAEDPTRQNQAVYELESIVGYYRARDDLLPGEAAILRVIRDDCGALGRLTLLDIGCGAGRTSEYLLPLTDRYVGIDFAAAMIAGCRERFASRFPRADFRQADARDLSAFDASEFDVVLFSFNGLDTLDHDGRARALREIRRVVKPGGWFAYSTHLLPNVEPRFTGDAPAWRANAKTRERFVALNAGIPDLAGRDWAQIRDAAHHFALLTHYIRPRAIAPELARAGFGPPRLFAGYEDRELDPAVEDLASHNWIYLLARAR